ncbi:PREDICTED: lactadherin-like [Branchiostoma belcheri]|uniref:Lactadherin-like n=1 Tax=Branchiostoma belcheri TaxID=7741 RepID=A0A6P4XUT6_BRABE|nr:PREDICTED: lactadherin-like [Branchiostoma belcheri]
MITQKGTTSFFMEEKSAVGAGPSVVETFVPTDAIGVCRSPLGMESGVIPDESITASSHWDADLVANNGRLNAVDGFGAWAAANSAVGEFLQVDFGHMKRVTGTIVQGRNVGVDQWVTSYKLQYSREATTWATYTVNDGSEKVFPGNTDRSTPVMNLLATDIDARYVRFVIQTWHNHVSMRAEILGCNIDGRFLSKS